MQSLKTIANIIVYLPLSQQTASNRELKSVRPQRQDESSGSLADLDQ